MTNPDRGSSGQVQPSTEPTDILDRTFEDMVYTVLTQGTLQTVARLGRADLAPQYGDHIL